MIRCTESSVEADLWIEKMLVFCLLYYKVHLRNVRVFYSEIWG